MEADDRGHVGRQSVANLVRRLKRLSESFRREDVLLDLSNVKSASSEFVLVLKVFRDRLTHQHRRVYICGPIKPAVLELDDSVVNSLSLLVPTADYDS